MAALGTPLTNESQLWLYESTDLAYTLSPPVTKSLALVSDPLVDPTVLDPSSAYEVS